MAFVREDSIARRKMRYCSRGKRIYPYEVGDTCPICGIPLLDRDFSVILSDAILRLLELGYDVRNAHGGFEESEYLENIMATNISISHSRTLLDWWIKPEDVEIKAKVLLSVSVSCLKLNPMGRVSNSLGELEQLLLDVVSMLPKNEEDVKERHYGSFKKNIMIESEKTKGEIM